MTTHRWKPVPLRLLATIFVAAIAVSVVCGTVDYSRAKGGHALVFSRSVAVVGGFGQSDYLGVGYRVRVWKTVSAGSMVPVVGDSVGVDPNYFYTRRGAELRFVFLPVSFGAVQDFKWLKRHFTPPPDFGAVAPSDHREASPNSAFHAPVAGVGRR